MKLDFKLAPKDKRLLLTLAIVAVLAISFFAFRAFNEKVDEVNKEISSLKVVRDDIVEKYQDKDKYEGKTYIYNNLYETIVNEYSAGLDQQSLIMNLVDFENKTESWINSATFTETAKSYEFGTTLSTNPSTEGEKVYSTDLCAYSTSTNLGFSGDYDQIKDLINRINTDNQKYKIDSMTLSYNSSEELINGTINLYSYSIAGGNRLFPPTDVDGVSIGTENIFVSDTHTSDVTGKTSLDVMKTDYDVYLNLNYSGSDVEAMVFGIRTDVLGKKSISSNTTSTEKLQIVFKGTKGNYSVSYKIGNEEFPGDGNTEPIMAGETLDFLILSSSRVGTEDTAVAKIDIINQTDKELNVGIVNDDTEKPRCQIASKKGDINVITK